jgi:hypothetical protein
MYYLNFLGMVMLRPVLVTLGGGAGGSSSLFTPLAPAVHLSTRFLLGAFLFEAVACDTWDGCAISLASAACLSFSFCSLFWAPPEPSFPSPSPSPPEPFHEPPFYPLPPAFCTRQRWFSSLSCFFFGVFPTLLLLILLPLLHVTL